jgi:hypothetical protein
VSKLSISHQGQMQMSNMLPAFHAFKDHKMEEINLSGDFRSHGDFIITPRLFKLSMAVNTFPNISVGPPFVKTCVIFERSIHDCSG